jgi:hypothetical protein
MCILCWYFQLGNWNQCKSLGKGLSRQVAVQFSLMPDTVDTVLWAPDDGWNTIWNMLSSWQIEISCTLLQLVGYLLPYYMIDSPLNIKFIDAKQKKDIFQFKNIKRKLYTTNAAIWYNKLCSLHPATFMTGSSTGPVNTRYCRYSVMSWWCVEIPSETCWAVDKFK